MALLLRQAARGILPFAGRRAFTTTGVRRNEHVFSVQDEDDWQARVAGSDVPVVVDFHAGWCGPCKLLAPRLESIIGAKGDKVALAKVDIDNVSELAMEYGVSAIPAVLAIKDGKITDKFVGLQDEVRIEAFVNKLIGE